MSIAPFSARPAPPPEDGRRNRLVVLIAALGICATLLAYSLSPGVRHAVSHAAHSVKHAVSGVLDHDKAAKRRPVRPPAAPKPARHTTTTGGTAP
jgi:hypothetical protein